MTDERRYGEKEVAEIFEAAASARGPEGRALASGGGLSLAELQEIGGEVGIAPERIAHAAAALDVRRDAAPRRKFLGVPVAVGRTVDLPRAPTDTEWEMLVAELRATFGAQGKDRSSGGLRAWTNGNLHANVEPTESGYRLRLGTLNANGLAAARVGIGGLVAALFILVLLLLRGELEEPAMAAMFAAIGLLALGANAIRLPRWADEREGQMEYIATRARTLLSAEPKPALIGNGG
jgi:hypothetical protein